MKIDKYLAAILLALVVVAAAWAAIVIFQMGSERVGNLKTFSSKAEIASFITAKIKATENDPLLAKFAGPFVRTTVGIFAESVSTPKATDYSTTNIQVEGVDEADIVKTDGRIIYAASSGGTISIVKAYPPEDMRVLSKIDVGGGIIGLFIGGERLIVLVNEFVWVNMLPEEEKRNTTLQPKPYFPFRVIVKIFDVSTPEKPVNVGEVIFEGSYVSSRMVGDYVYLVLTYPAISLAENLTILPRWSADGVWREISPSDIYYSDSVELPSSYTLIASLDILNASRLTLKSILTGYASCVYMSRSNLYAAFPVLDRFLGGWSETEIYRFAVDGLRIECEASGKVSGMVLNQFSMDEYNGCFRVATTLIFYDYRTGSFTSQNNVYVLDAKSLRLIGGIEGLAPGEQIYAARFMGNRCYLVTFKKVDPLFTIDLSDPANPRVLGALKIPGYSDYLHPYDENYLIGIGKEAVPAEEGDFAWYQGLKISLFNISEVEKPREVAKIIIGDRGTDSPVLRDHHALLFNRGRGLLVIPILEARIPDEDYPEGRGRPPWAYGRPVFQGAYVFHVSPEEGLVLRGRISHMAGSEILSCYEVRRALYIDDVLYTISDGKIKANSLVDLSEIAEVSLE
ncbi:beta-propeller domain-containing protein [Candidatus Bathyarchaeota archaeon]|nr:beta-propeller domain-containing protein [Candidatus Bathyarchaeota archaeon]